MRNFSHIVAVGALSLLVATPALARDQIRIVGSSTVFPFSTAVAEQFGKSTKFGTPVVESTGSGGGLKLFCAGVGADTPDITNASRRIKKSEIDTCEANGVKEIVEVKVGFDGIVLANSKQGKPFELSKKDIFMALAKDVPVDGKLVPNPYSKWNEVNPKLPAIKIEVLGPPPTSGTRDAFVELAMEGGAEEIEMLAALKKSDKKAFEKAAQSIREDGKYIEAGENDNLIVQKLAANSDAIGIFGFSFLDQNTDKLRGNKVGGIEPSFDNIASGKYGISRSLYFYVKKAHVGVIPGIQEYVAEFMSERAAGEDGYLADKGLIPLPAKELAQIRKSSASLEPLKGIDVAAGN